MSSIHVEFVGGPLDGPGHAKDVSGFSWVLWPQNRKYSLYIRPFDEGAYHFVTIDSYEECLKEMRDAKRQAEAMIKAEDGGNL